MATKGFQKFVDKFTGKKSESPQTEMRKEQVVVANNRKSAANMISKLKCINLYDKRNKLPKEIIQSEEFEDTINWAIKELSEPTVFTRNITSLDEKIEFAIDALTKAIREGWPSTARWAETALHQGLANLRQEISGIDLANADALYEKRLNYAIEMENIIKASQDYDTAEIALKQQQKRYQSKSEEVQQLREELNKIKNSFDGRLLMEEIGQNTHNPGVLSEEARKLKKKFEDYHKYLGSMQEIYLEVMTKTSVLNDCDRKIETIRNHLVELPVVNDPMLNAKIERANNMYVKNLQKTLDDIELSRRSYDQYLAKLAQISGHKVFQDEAANVIAMMQKIENEERERYDRAMRISQKVKSQIQRDKERMKQMEEMKNEINNIIAETQENIENKDENIIDEDEVEEETEEEQNVEYIYDPE